MSYSRAGCFHIVKTVTRGSTKYSSSYSVVSISLGHEPYCIVKPREHSHLDNFDQIWDLLSPLLKYLTRLLQCGKELDLEGTIMEQSIKLSEPYE